MVSIQFYETCALTSFRLYLGPEMRNGSNGIERNSLFQTIAKLPRLVLPLLPRLLPKPLPRHPNPGRRGRLDNGIDVKALDFKE